MDKILITFWIPDEVAEVYKDKVELIYPQERVSGKYTMEETLALLPKVEGVLLGGEHFTPDVIDKGNKLKVIGRLGVGCDAVDYIYAGKKGIPVVNTPNAVTHPTAELTVSIMMSVARCIQVLDKKLRLDKKCVAPFNYETRSTGLYGKTLGIIGFGRIGKAVAEKGKGLGMKIIYSDVIPASAEIEERLGAARMSTEELLKTADFVSVHCPYVPENHHLINAETLAMMKPSAYLINASRGKMVDEAALVTSLKNGTIKGAALDVYEFEPEINQDLLDLDNVVLVPHVGTWSYDARVAMAYESLDGMCAVLRGENPFNIFNRQYIK
ncbi:MAG: NAD(P)-dependent oxidoreductase [Oscillospiraceae bacterium]